MKVRKSKANKETMTKQNKKKKGSSTVINKNVKKNKIAKKVEREKTNVVNKKENSSESNIIDKTSLWSDLFISRPLLKVLYELKYDNPTYIQRDVIPLALEGKSILANSETGSGKTLAFVLPILERLLHCPSIRMRREGMKNVCITKILILLPTRELALQCYEVVERLTKYVSITCSLFCGGVDLKKQEMEFHKKKDIFICTPGRILDLLLNSSKDYIDYLEIVVFDEADKLLELGFKEECLKILEVCKFKKQILFFSATLTNDIKELANFSLKNPVFIHNSEGTKNRKDVQVGVAGPVHTIGKTSSKQLVKTFKISETLQQEFVNITEEKYRKSVLVHLCKKVYTSNAIIFFKTRNEAHYMYTLFTILKLKSAELHGGLNQKKRIESILKFKNEEVDFLLCTELASRGLDISHVQYVINYNVPASVIRYVHRIGRTARIGKEGIASTLYASKEKVQVKKIIKGVKKNKQSSMNIMKRTISKDHILHWQEVLTKREKELKEILAREKAEREIEKSEVSIQKIQNLIQFKDEIQNRPKRIWFLTNNERMKLKKDAKESEEGLVQVNAHHENKSSLSNKQNNKKNKKDKRGKRKNRDEEEEDEYEDEEEMNGEGEKGKNKRNTRSFRSIMKELKVNIFNDKKNNRKETTKEKQSDYVHIKKEAKKAKKGGSISKLFKKGKRSKRMKTKRT